MSVANSEYDKHESEFRELLPCDEEDAASRLKMLTDAEDFSSVERKDFLKGWWAIFWLNPGRHPDGWEDWESSDDSRLAVEASRRYEAGKITEDELYPAGATHNRIWLDQQALVKGKGTPVEEGDRIVLIRNSEGLYLARNEAEEIAWVLERSKAFRYYRKADAVDAQIREVKRQYDQEWSIELSDPRGEDLVGMRVLILTGSSAGEKGVCQGSEPDGRWAVISDSSKEVHHLIFEKESSGEWA